MTLFIGHWAEGTEETKRLLALAQDSSDYRLKARFPPWHLLTPFGALLKCSQKAGQGGLLPCKASDCLLEI